MGIEIEVVCPLGSKCEEIKDNKLYRCRWYVHLKGKDPQSEEVLDKWDCSIAWLPILSVENSQTNRGQTQALESFRNEFVQAQAEFNLIFLSATKVAERKQLVEIEKEKIIDIKTEE